MQQAPDAIGRLPASLRDSNSQVYPKRLPILRKLSLEVNRPDALSRWRDAQMASPNLPSYHQAFRFSSDLLIGFGRYQHLAAPTPRQATAEGASAAGGPSAGGGSASKKCNQCIPLLPTWL